MTSMIISVTALITLALLALLVSGFLSKEWRTCNAVRWLTSIFTLLMMLIVFNAIIGGRSCANGLYRQGHFAQAYCRFFR